MTAWHDSMAVALAHLQPELEPLLTGIEMQCVDHIDSTNSELMRRHKAWAIARSASAFLPALNPVVLVASAQSAGRGRMGRVWVNAANTDSPGNVLFSLGLPLQGGHLSGWSGLSLAVGVCVAEALQALVDENLGKSPTSGFRIGLKWPNDVWLRQGKDNQERKLAGILVETASAQAERYAVIGVGINLQAPGGVQAGSAPTAVGLQDVCPGVQTAQVLQQVLPRLALALRLFENAGFAPFQQRFAACDLLAGREVVLSTGSSGVACGVDSSGALQVRSGDGWQSVSSSEVSVRPQGVLPC